MDDFYSLPLNAWKIREPPQPQLRETALTVDLVLMPGLAFDKEGWRVGHGKGYYDRFLARMDRACQEAGKPRPRTIALALTEQILETGSVPRNEWDRKPDLVLTSVFEIS